MKKSFERHTLPNSTQKEIIPTVQYLFLIDLVVKLKKKNLTKKTPGPHGFTGKLHQTFKKESMTILPKFEFESSEHKILR